MSVGRFFNEALTDINNIRYIVIACGCIPKPEIKGFLEADVHYNQLENSTFKYSSSIITFKSIPLPKNLTQTRFQRYFHIYRTSEINNIMLKIIVRGIIVSSPTEEL